MPKGFDWATVLVAMVVAFFWGAGFATDHHFFGATAAAWIQGLGGLLAVYTAVNLSRKEAQRRNEEVAAEALARANEAADAAKARQREADAAAIARSIEAEARESRRLCHLIAAVRDTLTDMLDLTQKQRWDMGSIRRYRADVEGDLEIARSLIISESADVSFYVASTQIRRFLAACGQYLSDVGDMVDRRGMQPPANDLDQLHGEFIKVQEMVDEAVARLNVRAADANVVSLMS